MTEPSTEESTGMPEQPQQEHEWLQRLVGEWTYEVEMDLGPDQPREKKSGSESVRSLDGLWIVGEGKGVMPGAGEVTSIITLGYDPRGQRYVGTWVGSMMSHLWIYDGLLDAQGKVLTLDTEGPAMADHTKTARYRDIIELASDDERLLRAEVLGDDGAWNEFMVARYRRTG